MDPAAAQQMAILAEEAVFLATWFWRGLSLVGVVALAIGALSVASPDRSIRLYQWIMERFNWRVAPINMAREVRNTRALGVCLLALGGLALWMRASQGF